MEYQVSVKSLNQNSAVIEGYAVVFGGRDLVGQTFTPQTNFFLDSFINPPILLEHGLDEIDSPVGKVISSTVDNIGIKIQAQLDTSIKAVRDYLEKIKNGLVGFSSGTSGHMIKTVKNVITQWPIIEVSLTTNPAEPRTRTLGINQIKSFNADLATTLEREQENSKEGKAGGKETNISIKDFSKMDENVKSLADIITETREQAKKEAEANFQAEIKRINDAKLADEKAQQEKAELAKKIRDEVEAEYKSVRKPGYAYHQLSKPGDSDGENGDAQTYLYWLRTNDTAGVKSLLEGTAGSAPAMPTPMVQRIFAKAAELSIIRLAGATVNTTDGKDLDFVSVVTGTSKASAVSENGSFASNQDNYAKTTVSLYKAGNYMAVSREMLADSYFDLEGHISTEIAKAIAARENNWFINGAGSTEPYGILTRAQSGVTAASTGTIAYSEFLSLIGSVSPVYSNAPKAGFLVKRTVLYSNVLLGQTVSNFLTFQNMGVSGGQVGQVGGTYGSVRLQGYPVWDCSEMPSATTGQKVLVFGDFSQYQIVQKLNGFTVLRNDYENMASGIVRFYFETRLGGDLPQTEALKYIALA